MPSKREDNLRLAKELLQLLSQQFLADRALRHQNANIEVENFFRDWLNVLFCWNLENANWSGRANADSLDLEDRGSRIAVQVTTTQTPPKIRGTLEGFQSQYGSLFDRLVFVYPSWTKSGSRTDYSKAANGFPFLANRDRLCLCDLLREMQNLTIDKQNAALSFLQKELEPLASRLQLPMERNVAGIIGLIMHIADAAANPMANMELPPEAEKKLQRFTEHAEYLVRQYTGFIDCYKAVEAAREAVGYDAARSKRCTAWLRSHSLNALEGHNGDARQAFEAMVNGLQSLIANGLSDPDENAIRYYLADELLRCNVFPNSAVTI